MNFKKSSRIVKFNLQTLYSSIKITLKLQNSLNNLIGYKQLFLNYLKIPFLFDAHSLLVLQNKVLFEFYNKSLKITQTKYINTSK